MDTVKAKTSTHFPEDFLDALTIEDAIELRNIAISKDFTNKYNDIQWKTKEAISIADSEKLVLHLYELAELEEQFFIAYSKEIEHELPSRIKEEKQRSTANMLNSVGSLFIPGYEIGSAKQILISGLKIAGRKDSAKYIEEKVNSGLQACENALERFGILEKQVLLDFVDQMKKKYASRIGVST